MNYFEKFKQIFTEAANDSDGLKVYKDERVEFLQTIKAPGSPFHLDFSDWVNNQTRLFDIPVDNAGSVRVDLFGIYSGQAISFQQTGDGTEWHNVSGVNLKDTVPTVSGSLSVSGTSQEFILSGAVRFRCTVNVLGSGYVIAHVNLISDRIARSVFATTVGGAADGVFASGNPVRVGAKAVNSTSPVANNSAVDLISTTDRRLIVQPYTIPENFWNSSLTIENTTNSAVIKAAEASGVKIYLTSIHISHDTLAAAVDLVIRSGAGGAVIYRTRLQTEATEGIPIYFPTPIQSLAATLLEVATIQAVSGKIYINSNGFRAS